MTHKHTKFYYWKRCDTSTTIDDDAGEMLESTNYEVLVLVEPI
jgi:hypothetical protein